MMKKLNCIFVILFILTAVPAGLIGGETVLLDTEHIQRYRGNTGKWMYFGSYGQASAFIHKCGTDVNTVCRINNVSSRNIPGSYIFIPFSNSYVAELKKKQIDFVSMISESDQFIWPISNTELITSGLGRRWGKLHPGVDIPSSRGTIIRASMEGKVIFCGFAGGYGRMITLEHRNGYISKYAHNSVLLVKKGDYVQKGQVLALVGSTGHSTGNHLHFEIRCENIPLNPLDFLPEKSNLEIRHPGRLY